jgi:hypothetical protein
VVVDHVSPEVSKLLRIGIVVTGTLDPVLITVKEAAPVVPAPVCVHIPEAIFPEPSNSKEAEPLWVYRFWDPFAASVVRTAK